MDTQHFPPGSILGESPSSLVNLSMGRYRLEFEAQDTLQFPVFAGSAWRGVFGHALKRLTCVTREPNCHACLLQRACVYPYLFETPPPAEAEKLRRYPAAPHPYVIHLPWGHARFHERGESVTLELHLLGEANRHLSYVIHAFGSAGAHGFGAERARLDLKSVYQGAEGASWNLIHTAGGSLHGQTPPPIPIPEVPRDLQVHLETPLRLSGEEHLVTPERFAFHHLFRNLLRRFSLLCYFHSDQELEVDFRALSAQSRAIELAAQALSWQDWTRYSGRQHTRMTLGGLTGHFDLRDQELAPFWPYLWLGQWVHAGKGAVMGLGRYRLEPLASLPDQTRSPADGIVAPAESEARES